MSENNKAIVRQFLEQSIKERRTISELCSPGFTAHIGASPTMDLKGFQKYQDAYFGSFANNSITIEEMIAERDIVAFRGVVRARHIAEFMGIPVSGNEIVVPVIGMARISDNKIVEWWNSPDRLSWMQQIGGLH
jgi:predicted ester cyclase